MKTSRHECGWCAAWRELAQTYTEGRQWEAVLAARRLLRVEPESAECTTAVFVRGQWRQLGEDV